MNPRKNLEGIELLRIIAVLGVVWFHIDGLAFRRIGFSGLIVFVLIATALAGSSHGYTLATFLNKRARRLLLPWVFWFLAYLCLNLVTGRTALPYRHDPISAILAGPWIGLWYLPFAMVASLVTFALYRAIGRIPLRPAVLGMLACGVGQLFLVDSLRRSGAAVPPWAQWLHASAALPFGVAIAKMLAGNRNPWEIAAVCAAPLVYAGWSRFADPGLALTYLIAVPLTTGAFLLPAHLPRSVPVLGSLCMGVYLLHGALISLLKFVSPFPLSPYLLFALTAVIAFGATFMLKRVPLVRDLV